MDIKFDSPVTVVHRFPRTDEVTIDRCVRLMDKASSEVEGFRFAKGAPSTFGMASFLRDSGTVAHLPVDVSFCEVLDS